MNWGFYCRTCGASSQAWFQNPKRALQAFQAILPKIEALSQDRDVTLPTVQIPMVVFLSSHTGHDLWAECDTGVLRLTFGHPPGGNVMLPRFAERGDDRVARGSLSRRRTDCRPLPAPPG